MPCSRWAHSKCPAHKYRASSVDAVLDQNRCTDRAACAIRIATSATGMDRILPDRRIGTRLDPSNVTGLVAASSVARLISIARPRRSPLTGLSGSFPGPLGAPAQ